MNKVVLIGRFVADPDVRYSQNENSTCIARYTIAVNRRFKRDNEPDADFIRIVAFGKQGEFIEKYFSKGMKIAVVGRIQTGSYKDADGKTIYTTDIVAEEQDFVESKSNAQASNNSNASTDENGFSNIPEGIDEELPFQ